MKNQKIKKAMSAITLSILLLFLISVPFITSAATPENTTGTNATIQNPLKGNPGDLLTLLQTILQSIVMPIASVAAVVYIIWAGFQYVMAQGKPAEIEKANANLLWALIGVGVLLGATGISMVIQKTVGSLIN